MLESVGTIDRPNRILETYRSSREGNANRYCELDAGADRSAPFPPEGSFDALGRATPDVSALGENFEVVSQGSVLSVDGTSASAPAFANVRRQ